MDMDVRSQISTDMWMPHDIYMGVGYSMGTGNPCGLWVRVGMGMGTGRGSITRNPWLPATKGRQQESTNII
jgi:hypothetical protein